MFKNDNGNNIIISRKWNIDRWMDAETITLALILRQVNTICSDPRVFILNVYQNNNEYMKQYV